MSRVVRVLGAVVFTTASAVSAQECSPQATPFFEFQVTVPAVYLPDSTLSPRPTARRAASVQEEAALVQFVVDTLGRPDIASLKVLLARDRVLAAEARSVLPRWRFRPARLGGCVVAQIVQTPLER
jgi:hypothetical protein